MLCTAALAACNSIEETTVPSGEQPLNLSVSVQKLESRAIITGNALPDASQIGVWVTDKSGADYNNRGYANVLYTTTGNTCSSETAVLLDAKPATLYAFFPYDEEMANMTAIPVESTTLTDYMYGNSGNADLSNTNASIALSMNHILAGVKVGVKKTDANTDYSVSKIVVKSAGIAKTADFNLTDASLSNFTGQNEPITWNDAIALTTEYQTTDVAYFVPTEKSTVVKFIVTVDGTEYTIASTLALNKGNEYTFNLQFDNAGLNAEVSVTTVTINGFNKNEQDLGVMYPRIPSQGDVYAVNAEGELVDMSMADETCIAAALVVDGHRFMIEKNESNNAAWGGNTYLYWDNPSSDLSLENFKTVGGGADGSSGYLMKPDWTFNNTPHISYDHNNWTSGAISDFNGKTNTTVIVAASADARDMGSVLAAFNADEQQNQGYNDWYIPACGQLALIYMNLKDVNTILTAIGGQTISDSDYWSSSENSNTNGWRVGFYDGYVLDNNKDNTNFRVRFVRDIE